MARLHREVACLQGMTVESASATTAIGFEGELTNWHSPKNGISPEFIPRLIARLDRKEQDVQVTAWSYTCCCQHFQSHQISSKLLPAAISGCSDVVGSPKQLLQKDYLPSLVPS